jgi:hypothetical protein
MVYKKPTQKKSEIVDLQSDDSGGDWTMEIKEHHNINDMRENQTAFFAKVVLDHDYFSIGHSAALKQADE